MVAKSELQLIDFSLLMENSREQKSYNLLNVKN